MSSANDFEDKAARLFNRLNAATQPARIVKNKQDFTAKNAPSTQELHKIREEIQASDLQGRKKMRALSQNLRRLESSLSEENQSRAKMDETFTQTVLKLEKSMKSVLATVQKSFAQKEKKLEEKIDALIKSERKEIQGTFTQNEALMEDIIKLEGRATALATELTELRRARLELEEKITRQFDSQLIELRRIFEKDVRERQEKEGRAINSLKSLYKGAVQRILTEQRQRQQSQKMLMTVVQQLVTHILQA